MPWRVASLHTRYGLEEGSTPALAAGVECRRVQRSNERRGRESFDAQSGRQRRKAIADRSRWNLGLDTSARLEGVGRWRSFDRRNERKRRGMEPRRALAVHADEEGEEGRQNRHRSQTEMKSSPNPRRPENDS